MSSARMDDNTGEAPGQPQRPPASAHLLIDSIDRYGNDINTWVQGQGPSASNFSIVRNQALLYGYFTRIAITQLQFMYALPTVLAAEAPSIAGPGWTGNNQVGIQSPSLGTSAIITIPEGYYSVNTLATQLQTLIRATPCATAAFTVTQDPVTAKLRFETNTADTFQFQFATSEIEARTLRLIGMTGGEVASANLLATRTPFLYYTRYIDIRSDRLTKFQRVKDSDTDATANKTNIIARLYLVPPGQAFINDADQASNPFTIVVDYNTPKHCKWSPNETISDLDFQLLDDQGQQLPWSKYWPSEFQLTMVASET